MNMKDKMTTTKNLHSIDVNTIFAQLLKTDPMQEVPGFHEQMSFERGYNMFDKRAIAVMFKWYKHMEDMEVLIGVKTESLTSEQKQKELKAANTIKIKRSGDLKGRMCANGAP